MEKIADVELSFEGVPSLVVPRFEPWGATLSINKTWEEKFGEAVKLFIEMQSRGALAIRFSQYTLRNNNR